MSESFIFPQTFGIGEVLKRNKIRVEKNLSKKKIINSLALENYHLVLHDSDKTLDKQDNYSPNKKLNITFKAVRRSKLLLIGKELLYSPHLIITIAFKDLQVPKHLGLIGG